MDSLDNLIILLRIFIHLQISMRFLRIVRSYFFFFLRNYQKIRIHHNFFRKIKIAKILYKLSSETEWLEKWRKGRSRRGFLKVSELEARLMKRPCCETRVRV